MFPHAMDTFGDLLRSGTAAADNVTKAMFPLDTNSPRVSNEDDRLAALYSLHLLDTDEEEEFTELVKLAAEICSTPMGLLSLVDRDRQWFKASVGVELEETSRDLSFCSHAIQQSELFVVKDASMDARFQENALVTGDPGIRFYAGVPLRAESGHAVGTLCVLDTVARTLSRSQKRALAILARQIQTHMDLRTRHEEIERAMAEQSELLRGLVANEALFRNFADSTPNHTYLKSPDGRYVFYNRAFAAHFGIDQTAWLGKTDHEVFPAEIANPFRSHDLLVLDSNQLHELVDEVTDAAGKQAVFRFVKYPIRDAQGRVTLAGVATDITEEVNRQHALTEANTRLEHLATTDSLTGLFNRSVFEARIAIEFAVAARKRRPLSVVMMDIDNFKKRNDQFGHAAGDEAIRLLGNLLLKNVRLGDLAARIGGEEFCCVLPDTGAEEAKLFAERIQSQLRKVDPGPLPLTVSIGVVGSNRTTGTWERLLAQADDAMYEAKRSGKDKIVLHSEHIRNLMKEMQSATAPAIADAVRAISKSEKPIDASVIHTKPEAPPTPQRLRPAPMSTRRRDHSLRVRPSLPKGSGLIN